MEKNIITQNQIINEILKIGHGDLSIYNIAGLKAVFAEPELFAHLIAWNEKKGEVRDSKTALPILALRGKTDMQLFENAAAHLCLLSPRDLVRACRYNKSLASPCANGGTKWFTEAVEQYIRQRERKTSWWDRTAVQHRKSLRTLYALNNIKACTRAQNILFGERTGKMVFSELKQKMVHEVGPKIYPAGSVFEKIAQLKNMTPAEAAGTILQNKIPFLIAVGAIGGINDDIKLALIERMSPAELINNAATMKRWGVMDNPALQAAYQAGLKKVKDSKKVSTLKAGKAAKVVTDKKLSKTLEKVQEDRIDKSKGIDGDWLIIGDRSGSMTASIEVTRHVAAFLARAVTGQVHVVFCNTSPTYFNATGKTLEQITDETRRLSATGGTSLGCGLDLIRSKNIVVNGIAICSDGGDNTAPLFHQTYEKYVQQMGINPTIYLWHVPGDSNCLQEFCDHARIMLDTFELGYNVDYYAIPQLALTMRTSRYSLVEEIMDTKLLTLDEVFKTSKLKTI